MGLLVPIVLAVAGSGGIIAALLKLSPERNNLTIEAAQKAVALLRETMDELGTELERALGKIEALQQKLDLALTHTHELEQLLEQERQKAGRLERRLAESERRLAELDHHHDL